MASSGTRTAALALAVAFAGAAAWWGWSEHQRRELRAAAGALVQEASAALREGLGAARAPADAQAIRRLDVDAKALDGRAAELRRAGAGRERALVYAAEAYAISARQILRNLAQEQRRRRAVSERMSALSQHMNRANRRAPDWHRNALRLKDELEKSYFDYGLAAEALRRELDAFPDARAAVEAQLGPALLLDESIAAEARRRAADGARQVADEMQRARRMAGGR